jgi:hypothetical protein
MGPVRSFMIRRLVVATLPGKETPLLAESFVATGEPGASDAPRVTEVNSLRPGRIDRHAGGGRPRRRRHGDLSFLTEISMLSVAAALERNRFRLNRLVL